jgi:hypothetical protein
VRALNIALGRKLRNTSVASGAASRAMRPNGLPNPYDTTGNGTIFAVLVKILRNRLERELGDVLNHLSVVDSRVTQIGRASDARST